jgi:hypothetical protein
MEPERSPERPSEQRPSEQRPSEQRPSLLWRVVRSAFAPDVLEDGGHDAPLSRRGRLLFWATVSVLVAGIALLFVITLARK